VRSLIKKNNKQAVAAEAPSRPEHATSEPIQQESSPPSPSAETAS
jgi:hypothetical protein